MGQQEILKLLETGDYTKAEIIRRVNCNIRVINSLIKYGEIKIKGYRIIYGSKRDLWGL